MHDDRSSDGTFSRWVAAASDRDLLARFVRRSDQRVFAEIVRRHSTLVLGVCSRVLRDRHAAEDAFQATFLVLARSAGSIRRQRSLASWLHRVAYRVSMRALADSRRRKEQAVPMETVTSPDEFSEVGELYEQQLLDEELQELPEKYREPLVLHHLQGLSRQQVAERMGMSVAAVDGRLKRGKKELKLRLMRRGVEFGAVVAAIGLGQSAASAASIEPLISLTSQAAAAAHAGSAVPSTVSSQAAHLAGKELTIMSGSSKLVTTLGVSTVLVTLIGLTAGSAARGTESASRGAMPRLSTVVGGLSGDVTTLAQAESAESVIDADTADPPSSTETGLSSGDDLQSQLEELSTSLADLTESLRENSADVNSQQLELQESIEILRRQVVALQEQLGAVSVDSRQAGDAIDEEPGSRLLVQPLTLVNTRSSPAEERIEDALDSLTSIEFPGNPLADVMDYIGQIHNIPILLDGQTLLEAGVSPDEEISFVFGGIRLRSALEAMLESVAGVPLDYVIQDDAMFITTREKADSILETRDYNLERFTSDIVTSTTRPRRTWGRRRGGLQVSETFQASLAPPPDSIVVTQSQRMHREFGDLLRQLHRHTSEATTSADIEAALNQQLDQQTELASAFDAWRTVVSVVAMDHGLNVIFDEAALLDAGLTGNEQVSMSVKYLTPRAVLKIVLSQVGLTFVVEDEVIKVTTPEVAARADHVDSESLENQTAAPPADASAATRAIYRELNAPTDLNFPRTALIDVVAGIAEQHGIGVLLDERSIIDAGIYTDDEISLMVKSVTLRYALELLFKPIYLDFVVEDEVIKVTTTAVAAAIRERARTGAAELDPTASGLSDEVSIRGIIRVQGNVPALPPLVVAGDRRVWSAHFLKADVPDESLVVGDANGLSNVFVWLSNLPDDVVIPPPPSEPLVIASRGLKYVPHAQIAQTQELIRLMNPDPVPTNVHGVPVLNNEFNKALQARDLRGVPMQFDRQEPLPVRLGGDRHPHRVGYILPLDHPFADLTDDAGRFNIRQLPPGEYELNIWHERAGFLEQNLPITVPEDGPAEVDLVLDVDQLVNR